jgi:hypothetical protein
MTKCILLVSVMNQPRPHRPQPASARASDCPAKCISPSNQSTHPTANSSPSNQSILQHASARAPVHPTAYGRPEHPTYPAARVTPSHRPSHSNCRPKRPSAHAPTPAAWRRERPTPKQQSLFDCLSKRGAPASRAAARQHSTPRLWRGASARGWPNGTAGRRCRRRPPPRRAWGPTWGLGRRTDHIRGGRPGA